MPLAHAAGASLSAVAVLALTLAAFGYSAAALGLRERGRAWSRWRELAFWLGAVAAALALVPPLASAAEGDFRAHAAQHVLLGMLAPLAIVLAAPVTLGLRFLPRGTKRGLRPVLRSPWLALATHPATALLLSTGSLFLLYLTPLYTWVEENPLAHAAMHAHMLLAGLLFAWAVLAIDPSAHRTPGWLRLGVLLVAIAAHSVLAKLIYAHGLPHDASVAGSELLGGAQILYYGGDLAELLLAGFLVWGLLDGAGARSRRRSPAVAAE